MEETMDIYEIFVRQISLLGTIIWLNILIAINHLRTPWIYGGRAAFRVQLAVQPVCWLLSISPVTATIVGLCISATWEGGVYLSRVVCIKVLRAYHRKGQLVPCEDGTVDLMGPDDMRFKLPRLTVDMLEEILEE
jgi:hypothetical protein